MWLYKVAIWFFSNTWMNLNVPLDRMSEVVDFSDFSVQNVLFRTGLKGSHSRLHRCVREALAWCFNESVHSLANHTLLWIEISFFPQIKSATSNGSNLIELLSGPAERSSPWGNCGEWLLHIWSSDCRSEKKNQIGHKFWSSLKTNVYLEGNTFPLWCVKKF